MLSLVLIGKNGVLFFSSFRCHINFLYMSGEYVLIFTVLYDNVFDRRFGICYLSSVCS
jgi:hypothetical protein